MPKQQIQTKVKYYDFINALSKLTGVSPKGLAADDILGYKERLDQYMMDTSLPCSFEDMATVSLRVPVVNNSFFPGKENLLLEFLHETDYERVHLVQDAYLNGPESLFLAVLTARPVHVLATWMDLMKSPRLLLSNIENQPDNSDCIITAPLKSFL